MSHFDPSQAISAEFGIFGIPTTELDAKVILLPVPWEVTTSYGKGTSKGPQVIRQASEQIDLFDIETGKAFEAGYFMREITADLLAKNETFRAKAEQLIDLKTSMSTDTALQTKLSGEINAACEQMTAWVYKNSGEILASGKLLGLVGGDHSTPLGAIHAISDQFKGDFGVLHIDAHADLRNAYQGLKQSHASIMYNVMTADFAPKKLVQVGIRDFCEEEYNFIQDSKGKIKTFFDLENKRRQLSGETWASICREIVSELPQNVYISFDIDGLDPALCPNTGTPVAGGLNLNETFFLFRAVIESGRKLVGFDLNEVSSGELEQAEWDGNVGARVLYKLCGWLVKSNS